MRHVITLTLASVLIGASLPGQIPPDIQAERYLWQAVKRQDFAAAQKALETIRFLGIALPVEFYFRSAQVAEQATATHGPYSSQRAI